MLLFFLIQEKDIYQRGFLNKIMKNGIIQIYTGDGKGKTTAAFGQSIRAAGQGLKVVILQFLKNENTGEFNFISNNDKIKIKTFNSQNTFIWNMSDAELEKLKFETLNGFEIAENLIKNNGCDLLVLDEAIGTIHQKLISVKYLKKLLQMKSNNMEIVLTGRDVPFEIIDEATLVTEMKMIKHPFEQKIKARKGIEF